MRFGNVFNSKGSVIETFIRQIELGLPVTLTDLEVSRFFMKIEEAANLSLLASTLNVGDIHILDMGEPIKLTEVIKKLSDVLQLKSQIVIVGLREGEKIQEELWSSEEHVVQTENRRIKAINLATNHQTQIDYSEDPLTDEEAFSEINRFMIGAKVEM